MKWKVYNSVIAFFGGLFGVSLLFILFYLIFDALHFKNPFPPIFYGYLLTYFFNSFIEEGMKFLLIKRNIGQLPYGFLLGFSYGRGESVLKYPFWEFGVVPIRRSGAILFHTITAGIICYFIHKKKPIWRLLIVVIIHTGFNLLTQGV